MVTLDSVVKSFASVLVLNPATIFFSVKYIVKDTNATKDTIVIAVIDTIAKITIKFSLISITSSSVLLNLALSTHVQGQKIKVYIENRIIYPTFKYAIIIP